MEVLTGVRRRRITSLNNMKHRRGFESVHPVPATSYYAVVLLLSMLLFHPVFLVTSLISSILINGVLRIPNWQKIAPFYVLIGLLVLVINPLFSHRGSHIWFYWLDNPITWESIIYGLTMALSLMTILFLFLSYQRIINPQKVLFIFGNVVPKTALLVMMALRFIPLLLRRIKDITHVQRTRGLDIRKGSWSKRLRDGGTQLQILLTGSLEEALETADSIQARGYGKQRRTSYYRYKMNKTDVGFLFLLIITSMLCIGGWILGYGELKIYPQLQDWRLTGWQWLTYISFCVLLSTPLLIEAKERWLWR